MLRENTISSELTNSIKLVGIDYDFSLEHYDKIGIHLLELLRLMK